MEIRERCKGVHCVDLGESFPMSIYLQNLASIQPRTSPSKFGGKLFNIIHSCPYSGPPRELQSFVGGGGRKPADFFACDGGGGGARIGSPR